jgi:hypothetical protein
MHAGMHESHWMIGGGHVRRGVVGGEGYYSHVIYVRNKPLDIPDELLLFDTLNLASTNEVDIGLGSE